MANELDDLEKQINELQIKRQSIIDAMRSNALKQAIKLVADFGFTARELGIQSSDNPLKQKRVPKDKLIKPITFRDPQNNLEWDGQLNQKGRKPEWIVKAIANNQIENFKVK
jgi:DNA-binding protein H-NS